MYSAIRANKRNTVIIMMVFLLLIGGLGALAGYLYDDYFITGLVLFIAIIYALIEYFAASRMAISMAGGREIKKQDNPTLWNVVENLAIANGQPMPRVFIIDDPSPNAFATGATKNSSMVAVSTGLLQMMNQKEVEAVLAHEMSHVANGDMVTMTLVQGVMNTFVVFISRVVGWVVDRQILRNESDGPGAGYFVTSLVLDIALGFLAGMVVAAFSRHREYRADEGAARVMGRRHRQPLCFASFD